VPTPIVITSSQAAEHNNSIFMFYEQEALRLRNGVSNQTQSKGEGWLVDRSFNRAIQHATSFFPSLPNCYASKETLFLCVLFIPSSPKRCI